MHGTKQTIDYENNVYNMRAKTRRQSGALLDLIWEHVSWVTRIFLLLYECFQMTMTISQALILKYK